MKSRSERSGFFVGRKKAEGGSWKMEGKFISVYFARNIFFEPSNFATFKPSNHLTYEQTLEYLFSQLPMFTRIGAAAYKADLNNTIEICNLLNNPQNNFKSIHIAGTNGKGSTSHMLAAIFQQAGYKTGLYTSPHLKDFRERIRINSEMISKNFIVDFVEQHKNDFEKIKPSFFEMSVGLCFDYFSKEKVDIAIIETGLGGRLDSTNIITPLLSVITNISFDHKDLLGDTLEKIAAEKAGIIKENIPVVIGETQCDEIKNVFVTKAEQTKSKIFFADEIFRAVVRRDADHGSRELGISPQHTTFDIHLSHAPFMLNLEMDLIGNYQQKNILTVLQSVEIMRQKKFRISDEQIRAALKNVKSLSSLRGRWDVLQNNPTVICDVAHNEAGLKIILEQLQTVVGVSPHHTTAVVGWQPTTHFVLGFVKDKDISNILKLFPQSAKYYFCKPNIERGLDENDLKEKANSFSLNGNSFATVRDAYDAAMKNAKQNDVVFIGGSTFVVAEII